MDSGDIVQWEERTNIFRAMDWQLVEENSRWNTFSEGLLMVGDDRPTATGDYAQ